MKRIYTTIILLLGFLIFAFFKSDQTAKHTQTPLVGILQLTSHPALDSIHKGIIAGLKSEEIGRAHV